MSPNWANRDYCLNFEMVVLYHQDGTQKTSQVQRTKQVYQPVARVSGKPNFLQQFKVRFLQDMFVAWVRYPVSPTWSSVYCSPPTSGTLW